MQNILFVLYHDFHSNSAVHVHHFANHLVTQGLDCVVAVPNNKNTVSDIGKNLYEVTEFSEISELASLFHNNKAPDIVHAWTPREVVRLYCEKLGKKYDFKLFIHLEDNEEHLLEKFLKKPYKKILNTPQNSISEGLSHPIKYREFLSMADGVTIIMDKLKQFVPDRAPTTVLWPGVNTDLFFPREPDLALAASLGVPLNSTVLCYTGNVHAANAHEVRSLYLAVAMMNREVRSTVLLRTGKDYCNFLGEDDRWARQYSIELGYIDRLKLPEILALADVLIQPGRSDEFNDYRFPSKLPEFLAMGKPVILPAANIGRFMEHMKDALVLPVVDALHIVKAVNLVLNDEVLYGKLGRGALNFAETNLSWRKNSENLKSFYEAVWKDGNASSFSTETRSVIK